MLVFRNPYNPPLLLKRCVLAIGNFDSVHLGHRAVLNQARDLAADSGRPCVVMTFTPHPRQYFSPLNAHKNIEPPVVRLKRMRELGIDGVLLARFNAAFAGLSAEAFVAKLLVEALEVGHVVVGEDFHFGYKRSGDIRFLQDSAVRYRFGCTYVPPVLIDNQPVSSTRVRGALSNGNMDKVSALLGRPYEVIGRVIHGAKRGRELNVPTANIALDGLHLPPYGVYAVRFKSENGQTNNPWWEGVANLGVRPTFDVDNIPLLEIHAIGTTLDLYGKQLRVQFISFLREEKRFENSQQLVEQIVKDTANAIQALRDTQ